MASAHRPACRPLATAALLAALAAAAGALRPAFVGARGPAPLRAATARAAALAPAPARPVQVPFPDGIDKSRFGVKVRWLMDEDAWRTSEWHLLLLDKTYQSSENTLSRVAGCLAIVIGLASEVARRKAAHAKEHYFCVVETSPEFSEVVQKAQALQLRGLVVRVTPAAHLSQDDEGYEDWDAAAGDGGFAEQA